MKINSYNRESYLRYIPVDHLSHHPLVSAQVIRQRLRIGIPGEFVEALRFADQGRAQSLRDLMDSMYVSGEEYDHDQSHYPEMSARFSPDCVPSNTVFMEVVGKKYFSG